MALTVGQLFEHQKAGNIRMDKNKETREDWFALRRKDHRE